MKNLFWTLILTAVVLNLCADKFQQLIDSGTKWRGEYAVQQVEEAKARWYTSNADNENALNSYNQGTAEERLNTLEDWGLLSEKTALCIADPGAMDEAPTPHSVAEMGTVRSEAYLKLGELLARL